MKYKLQNNATVLAFTGFYKMDNSVLKRENVKKKFQIPCGHVHVLFWKKPLGQIDSFPLTYRLSASNTPSYFFITSVFSKAGHAEEGMAAGILVDLDFIVEADYAHGACLVALHVLVTRRWVKSKD